MTADTADAIRAVLVDKSMACKLLGGISERFLTTLMTDGKLNARMLGSRVMFRVAELEEFADALPSWEPKT